MIAVKNIVKILKKISKQVALRLLFRIVAYSTKLFVIFTHINNNANTAKMHMITII